MQVASLVLFGLVAAAAAASNRDPCMDLVYNQREIDYSPSPSQYLPTEPFTTGLKPHVKKWADRFPLLKNLIDKKIDETQSKAIKSITGRGFMHYSQQASLQAIEAVDGNMYDAFVKYMLSTLEIPKGKVEDSINAELFDIVRWADNSDWVQFNTIFSDSQLRTKYICVLGHRNEASNTYDFIVADFRNKFLLAPDILVVTERSSKMWGLFGSSKTKIIYLPPSLKKEDLELITNFFDLSAFTRFAKMLDVQVLNAPADPTADPITVIAAVKAGLELWGTITKLFKTTSTSRLVKEITGEGFDFYVQRSRVQVIQGMNEHNMVNRLVPMVPRLLNLEAEISKDVKFAICLGPLMDEGAFNKNDFLFDKKGTGRGDVRFVDVIVQRQTNSDKYNLVLANVAQEFSLAPHVHVIENSKSYVGGIYERTKIEYREVPRSLTLKDMEVLMAFFHVTTFKRISMHLNVKIPYPDPVPPK